MKAAFNGVLNCSILDGWWDEMYDPDVGWAIPSAEWQDDIEAAQRRSRRMSRLQHPRAPDRAALLRPRRRRPARRVAAPGEGVPRPARPAGRGVPHAQGVRRATTTSRPPPAATTLRGRRQRAGQGARALEARRSSGPGRRWPSTPPAVEELRGEPAPTYRVTAQVSLGDLDPTDVEVQLIYGAVDLDDELRRARPSSRWHVDGDGDVPGWHRYRLDIDVRPGRQLRLHRARRPVPPRPPHPRVPRPRRVGTWLVVSRWGAPCRFGAAVRGRWRWGREARPCLLDLPPPQDRMRSQTRAIGTE